MVRAVTGEAPSRAARVLHWFNFVLMPPRLAREFYGRRMGLRDRVAFALVLGWMRLVYRFVPEWLRCTIYFHSMAQRVRGPYPVLKRTAVNGVARGVRVVASAYLGNGRDDEKPSPLM